MMLRHDSRETGIEFAVGCFLLALGIGLLIPRPGLGLYSLIHAGGNSRLWSMGLLSSALLLTLGSTRLLWRIIGLFNVNEAKTNRIACAVRLVNVAIAMLGWTLLAFKFVDGGLWGATLQALMAIFLLNACAWRLYRYWGAHGT